MSKLPNLRSLAIGNFDITDAGFAALGKFRQLKDVYVNRLEITDDALDRFPAGNLQAITFSDCDQITSDALEQFSLGRPDARVAVVREGRLVGTYNAGELRPVP